MPDRDSEHLEGAAEQAQAPQRRYQGDPGHRGGEHERSLDKRHDEGASADERPAMR